MKTSNLCVMLELKDMLSDGILKDMTVSFNLSDSVVSVLVERQIEGYCFCHEFEFDFEMFGCDIELLNARTHISDMFLSASKEVKSDIEDAINDGHISDFISEEFMVSELKKLNDIINDLNNLDDYDISNEYIKKSLYNNGKVIIEGELYCNDIKRSFSYEYQKDNLSITEEEEENLIINDNDGWFVKTTEVMAISNKIKDDLYEYAKKVYDSIPF